MAEIRAQVARHHHTTGPRTRRRRTPELTPRATQHAARGACNTWRMARHLLEGGGVACNTQHATRNTQRAARNAQHATRSTQRAARSARHTHLLEVELEGGVEVRRLLRDMARDLANALARRVRRLGAGCGGCGASVRARGERAWHKPAGGQPSGRGWARGQSRSDGRIESVTAGSNSRHSAFGSATGDWATEDPGAPKVVAGSSRIEGRRRGAPVSSMHEYVDSISTPKSMSPRFLRSACMRGRSAGSLPDGRSEGLESEATCIFWDSCEPGGAGRARADGA